MNGTTRPYRELLSEFEEVLKYPRERKEHPAGLPEIERLTYDFCADRRCICIRMNVPIHDFILKMVAEGEGFKYGWRPERPGTPETITIIRPRRGWFGQTILTTQPYVNHEGPLLMIPPKSAELAADYLSRYLELHRMKAAQDLHDTPALVRI